MLLATKLFIPQPHRHTVRRPRLLQLMTDAQQAKLVLVCAPAGSGKTTLLADWIAAQHTTTARRVAWLALDEGDNDPVRFLTYVVAALQTAKAALAGSVQALLQSPQPPAIDGLLPSLLQELADATEQFALVLDDYHLINTQQIHDALTFLITHLPPNVIIILLSRNDPPLPLSRWRVRRELTEIRQRELRFTAAELTEFMRQEVAADLDPSLISALLERTEGWIAGLQLAALSMADRTNLTDFVQTFTGSHLYIVDYLSEEVLNRQAPAVRNFLLQTSILTRLSAPLCDAVLGAAAASSQESQARLTELERANLFIIPLDHERRWYRYHHLFAEVLQKWLRQEQAPIIPLLHRRACQWYGAQGLLLDAIHHALAAGDAEHAASLLEAVSDTLRRQGEFATLAGLLSRLPVPLVQAHPRLALEQANTLVFQHQLDEAEGWLTIAEAANTQNNADPVIRGNIAAIRTDIALNKGDLAGTIRLAQAALTDLAPTDWYTRSFVMLLQGIAHFWSLHYPAAEASYNEAIHLAHQSGVQLITIYALASKAEVQQRQGHLQEAHTTLLAIFDYARAHGLEQSTMLASSHVIMADLLYEWNELTQAAAHLAESLTRAQQANNPRTQLHVYASRLHVARAQQQDTVVQQSIQYAEQLIQTFQLPPPMVNDFQIGRWRLALQEGNLPLVAAGLQGWLEQPAAQRVTDVENVDLLRAQLLIAQAQYTQALALLHSVNQAAAAINHLPQLLSGLALAALAYAGAGHHAQAQQVIQQLLQRAQPAGFVRTLVDAGPALARLIAACEWHTITDHAERERLQHYAGQLLAAFPSVTTRRIVPALVDSPRAPSPLVEPLSGRELEVLQLVAQGLSNTQIAERLIISVGTVKRHLNNIFGKLGVGSRTEALARARELALF